MDHSQHFLNRTTTSTFPFPPSLWQVGAGRRVNLESCGIHSRTILHALGKQHEARATSRPMPLAPGATAVDTNPPANHFEPFHFPVLPRPISHEEAQFPTNTVNQDGTDAWLLGGTGEPSAQQPTRIPPEPFTHNHSIFKKQCSSVPHKYRDKHSWAKLQAAERESNVESAGFHRGPEDRLLPVMDAGFKTHRPKRQMTVVTRGLKISSLYHLHKEIFPDTGMEFIFEKISDHDNTELEC